MKYQNIIRVSSIVLLLCVISCSTSETRFRITNSSNQLIDSLSISCSGTNYLDKKTLINIKPKESIDVILNMDSIKRTDGNYFIEIFSANINKSKTFGYYSNGYPTGSKYLIKIKKDTIYINEKFN